ncbi:hypothetical protein KFE96_00490 [Kordiimonas sp. SCSIO 12603]|uniref:hypothetical protein n=1 Tax=Kordiimonas sp. SCSIO 12603 TaxID=2829596 RepID=UPI00210554A5|nr:hypothetical protein [Kordiimonas sp. SCSIO 12603]UTW58821.1 hypothetical protein KFE96_00490 [Kordiimonas sp. SCSIO 12603]
MNKFTELNQTELDLVNGAGNGFFATEEDAINCENEIRRIATRDPNDGVIIPFLGIVFRTL